MGFNFNDLAKGLSSFLPQDDPGVKMMSAQTEVSELETKLNAVYTDVGKKVMDGGGANSFPEEAQRIALLKSELSAAKSKLSAMKSEQEAVEREKKAAEEASTCPDCGHVNPEGVKFCQECGTRLGGARELFCPGCGAKNAPGTRFCGECGARLGG